MSRPFIPFFAGDLSALARSLRAQLKAADHLPSHVEMLNMLARGAGHRNFQSVRAHASLAQNPRPEFPSADFLQVKRLAGYFDSQGRLKVWPSKACLHEPCLWVLWSRLEPRRSMSEAELSALLRSNHLFGDHALLRRELCDRGLLARTPDGREYRRVERSPSPEGLALIRHLNRGTR